MRHDKIALDKIVTVHKRGSEEVASVLDIFSPAALSFLVNGAASVHYLNEDGVVCHKVFSPTGFDTATSVPWTDGIVRNPQKDRAPIIDTSEGWYTG